MSRALGRYELVRPLARGGMAEVFLARRRAGGVEKLLVVKRIRAERANDVRFQELFKREAKLSMSLAHQNIVPVFDFGRIGDRFFLAMERVEGKDLGSSLASPSRELPPPLVAAFIAAECCQALDYAHGRKNPDGTSRDIVHRDVTPRNVLLSWSGEVKLTDFGIASLAGEDANKLVGTPAYMAPEQALGEAVDARSDIYGLGMVLREALTGQRARPGDTPEALMASARTGALAPWPDRELPPALVAIVDRATAARPDDRYADIHAFAAELDGYLVAERAANRGEPPGKQLSAWLARIWGNPGDDAGEPPPDAEQAEFLSFLDDGVDAIGTGTQRSLAATAADEPVDPPEAKAAPVEPAPAPVVAPAPSSPRSRRGPVAVVGVVALAVVVTWAATRGGGAPASPDAAVVAIVEPDATAVRTPDAAAVVEPDARVSEPDAAAVAIDAPAATPDAPVPVVRTGSGSNVVRTGSGGNVARTGSGSGSGSSVPAGSGSAPPPVAVTRKVHINATPWAYFTVDGGPRMQTPKLLDLTPGPHQIHFENSVLKVERDVTLDVPADRDISHVEPLR